jgi:aminoglycoside phosphotransferase (APT) family kinase protein
MPVATANIEVDGRIHMQQTVDKNNPTPEWIDQLRGRFRCEKEIDRVLTRKLTRRSKSKFSSVSLAALVHGTEALLRSELGEDFEISDARWLTGGASKLQMAFTLRWNEPGVGPTKTPLVLRMEPTESIVESSRLREFQVINAVKECVPVPPAYWVDPDGEFLPYPAIVYGFASGVTKPTSTVSGVSGVGTNLGPALRPALAPQFVEHLARIHRFDWSKRDLGAFDVPSEGTTQAVEWQLNWYERVWEEDSNEDIPLLRVAMAWMRKNMPPVDRVSLVHGDFRTGNFLFSEQEKRITAWLDWELAHLGDRHEDLAWAIAPPFGHMADDGKTLLVAGLMPKAELCKAYEKASGLPVNPKTLAFYEIFTSYKAITITTATGYRASRGGKTHQDVLVAWLCGISFMLQEHLRLQLKEVL